MSMLWIGIGICVLGLYIALWSLRLQKEMQDSLNWPSVQGEITKNRVVKWKATSENRSIFLGYDYEVSGNKYSGYKPFLYAVTTEVLALSERFPVGQNVQVFYNPSKPAHAVLIPGGRANKKGHELYMGILVLIAGLCICFSQLWKTGAIF